jgi:hypothetical protein
MKSGSTSIRGFALEGGWLPSTTATKSPSIDQDFFRAKTIGFKAGSSGIARLATFPEASLENWTFHRIGWAALRGSVSKTS